MADAVPPNRIPWWHRTVSAVVLAACTVTFAGLCAGLSWLVLFVFLGGCAAWHPVDDAKEAAPGFFRHLFTGAPGMGGPNYSIISITASLLFVVGIITLVASFWIPLIPRRASIVCLCVSVGCWVLQYVLDAYLGLTVLVLMVAGIAAAAPWVIGYVRLSFQRAGQKLALTDPRAGVAIQAVANPAKLKRRKELLYEAMAGTETAPKAGSGALKP